MKISSRIDQLNRFKEDKIRRRSSSNQPQDKLEPPSISLSVFLDRLNSSLIRTLNIDSKNDKALNKVPFIQHDKINSLEHNLQLLNFKEKSTRQTSVKLEDVEEKNRLLTELNSLYYDELMADHHFIKRVITLIQSVSNGEPMEDASDSERQQLRKTIGELQKQIDEMQGNNSTN
ncbi:hypothetical protein FOA43_004315 [Brettanomyces nanus]|uniref:Uncharacterized protein n=1 Tax=Eeniella nana TaxID=13502 RepID=A0A875S5M1_EENNA|nr:uncharacterized protein FOA43_004315 [Brettanomyces nanus]QPG76921.1 hypothetical protein FOA43_004315 [Brettanomyces nanus]